MRLDKYLKVSRLIKRRTVAKEFAENERITVNGRVAKPSTKVNVGDILAIQMGGRRITVEILDLKDNIKAGEAKSLYRIVNEEPPRV
ncbi:MAG: RNA-binding S4 domain-containing protein [Syntrophomonadaceae bacterium]|jgi:ribosomal 50S subunit-recycling heat shock protein|nr:RNA-binding S4 domain-containing protein [Syntrophomonadaceae bacterium]